MKTEIHNFKVGDTVTVFNRSFSQFVIEGKATIVALFDMEDEYLVRFGERKKSFRRFVDPNGQDDPEGYLAQLNATR
jgi:hypothetical protein